MRIVRLIVGAALAAAASQPALAQETVKRFGSWGLTCSADARCALTQRVALDQQGRKVALSVFGDARGPTPHLAFRFGKIAVPKAGIGIKIGQYAPRRYRIRGCDANLCEARVPVTQALLNELRTSPTLLFAFFVPDGRQATLPVDLKGFGEGWRALSARARTPGAAKSL